MRAQGQKLTIKPTDELEVNVSLAPDVVRETFSLDRVLLFQYLVAAESLHHADVSTQWQGFAQSQTVIPGHQNHS